MRLDLYVSEFMQRRERSPRNAFPGTAPRITDAGAGEPTRCPFDRCANKPMALGCQAGFFRNLKKHVVPPLSSAPWQRVGT